jgi:class 3 adenylate cyclase
MPVVPLASLLTVGSAGDQPLMAMADRLAGLAPGIVLATGQGRSGKLTILAGLAGAIAGEGGAVVLLASEEIDIEVFRPLPQGWSERIVHNRPEEWERALADVPAGAVVMLAGLDRSSAPAFWNARTPRGWMLATLDTPLLGADVAYAMRELGVSYGDFLARVRCIWSQFLLPAACPACAAPAQISDAELEELLPGRACPGQLLECPGCAECQGSGGAGRIAASEVVLVTDDNRAQVSGALVEGQALPGDSHWHLTVHAQSQRYLGRGAITVTTYRDIVRRNPLLRAQNQLEREQAHSFKLSRVFEKFVSPEVKRRLMDSHTVEAVVRGEARDITCLFCDMRGFTARAEARDPETLFAELNRYFSEVVDCALASDGTIDKFIGDAIMVVWGAPLEQPDHAARALQCALAIRERIAAYNALHSADLPIQVGMGLNSGHAIAGCVGTDRRMEYTVLGDTVNIAARLESRAEPGQILVSAATRAAAGSAFDYGDPRDFELRGKTARVQAFALQALK